MTVMNTTISINDSIKAILIENSEVLFGTQIDENLIQFQKTRKEVEGDITLVIFPFVKALKCSPIEAGNKIGAFLKERISEIASFEVFSSSGLG
jgi:arginyl-tRNA synthetase